METQDRLGLQDPQEYWDPLDPPVDQDLKAHRVRMVCPDSQARPVVQEFQECQAYQGRQG